MENIPPIVLIILSTVMALFMGIFVMILRIRSQKKPTNSKKIIIPPIAMSSGATMFFFEEFRVSLPHILEASIVGILFSTILIATSKFEIRNDDIYLKPSKAFLFILIGLLTIRVIMKILLSGSIDVGELAGMFWILAFFMLWPWRVAMFIQYKRILKTHIIK